MLNFTSATAVLEKYHSQLGGEVLVRTPFQYKNHRIRIWYFEEFGFKIFQIEIINEETIVFINNSIPYYNNDYYIDTWVPEPEYNALKKSLFSQDNWSPAPMYKHIKNIISADNINSYQPSTKAEFHRTKRQRTITSSSHEEDYIYFSHLRISHVGKTMRARIHRMMSYKEANNLITRLEKIGRTLVFSDNPADSKDLYAAISKYDNIVFKQDLS